MNWVDIVFRKVFRMKEEREKSEKDALAKKIEADAKLRERVKEKMQALAELKELGKSEDGSLKKVIKAITE